MVLNEDVNVDGVDDNFVVDIDEVTVSFGCENNFRLNSVEFNCDDEVFIDDIGSQNSKKKNYLIYQIISI